MNYSKLINQIMGSCFVTQVVGHCHQNNPVQSSESPQLLTNACGSDFFSFLKGSLHIPTHTIYNLTLDNNIL